MTGADYCNIRNPSSSGATGLRKLEGEIRNIAEHRKFTISCPLLTFFNQASYSVSLIAWNYNTVGEDFKCVLREIDLLDFLVRSYSRRERVPEGEGAWGGGGNGIHFRRVFFGFLCPFLTH